MKNASAAPAKQRVGVLLALAFAVSLLLLWVVKGFVLALVLAALLTVLLFLAIVVKPGMKCIGRATHE